MFAPLAGLTIDRAGLRGGLLVCAALGTVGTAVLVVHLVRRRAAHHAGFEGERAAVRSPAVRRITAELVVESAALTDPSAPRIFPR
jgi:hypothetical protein